MQGWGDLRYCYRYLEDGKKPSLIQSSYTANISGKQKYLSVAFPLEISEKYMEDVVEFNEDGTFNWDKKGFSNINLLYKLKETLNSLGIETETAKCGINGAGGTLYTEFMIPEKDYERGMQIIDAIVDTKNTSAQEIIEQIDSINNAHWLGKFGKIIKAGAMALPVVGGLFTAKDAHGKIDDINNSNLSTEAKAAAHSYNTAMMLDAFIDPSMVAGMAGQQAAKEALIKQFGDEITTFLVQTDGEALAEVAGKKRFENAQQIIDALPNDHNALQAITENRNFSQDLRLLAGGKMMMLDHYYDLTPSGASLAIKGKEVLDKTAEAMYERQEASGKKALDVGDMNKALADAKAAGCTDKNYQCSAADTKDKAPTTVAVVPQPPQKTAAAGV